MSRHEGVSCDSCLKGNFRGRRYKCLICYDYDLCAACYEAGATTTRHTTEHPMQCILTRADFELYYGGEALTSVEQPQAYTCPYCNRMGFTDQTLQEHVTNEHSDISFEVVCPVCASVPGGDPNLMTDDFAGHLTLEHRSGPRDLISFLDEPVSTRHNVRRIPHTSRGVTGSRSRRSNMHFSTLTNTTTNVFSVGQGSSGDDDRDRDRNNRQYRPISERAYGDPAPGKKDEDDGDNEENDPNVKIVWLYPLDKDGNLIIPEDEIQGQVSAPENLFEARSNTLFSSDSRRVFYSSPPNNPTGDSIWSPVTDTDTWQSLPLQEIPTVSTYDLDTSFNSLNVSGSSEAAQSVEPFPSTSTNNRPWRARNYYSATPMTCSNLSFTTNSATVVAPSTSGTNPNPGRYVIPQRRVHFQTSNTASNEVVDNSGTRIESFPIEPQRSQEQDTVDRTASQASTSADTRREPPRTIFFSDTASSSSDSDTNNTNSHARNVNSAVGTPLRRMQVSDSIGTPSASTHTYTDDADDVWEPLPPVHDSNTSQQSFDYSQFPNNNNDSVPNNSDQFWDSNPSDQIDQTESNDTDAFADVSSMLNQSFDDSGVHFSRRQNQHDVAPRVKDDRLVIPLFRLDQAGNLIYDDLDENAEASESSDESSRASSVQFFAPMDYSFDPVYSPFPSASSSSPSSDEGDRPLSRTHGPFGIFPPRKPKRFTTANRQPEEGSSRMPVVRNTNRVQSLYSMAGAELSRAPRPTPLVSPISSSTSRGSFFERGRIPSTSRGTRSVVRRPYSSSICLLHAEASRTSTSSRASTSGLSQPSSSSGEVGMPDHQSHECPRRRVQFTDPLVMPNNSRVELQEYPEVDELQFHLEGIPEPPEQQQPYLDDELDDISVHDLPPLPDSDSSGEQYGIPIPTNIPYSPLTVEVDDSMSDDSLNEE